MKRWLRLVIAAAVIAALIVTLSLVRNREDTTPEPAAPAPQETGDRVTIVAIPRETISRIDIRREDSDLTLLGAEDGTFVPEYDFDVAWDRQRITRIVGSVASLSSSRLIEEDSASLDQYGLSSPALTVTTTVEDGSEIVLEVGNRLPGGSGYYAKTPENPTVYSVSTVWLAPFFYSLDDLRIKTLPSIDPAQFVDITIRNLNGRTIRAVRQAQIRNPEFSLSSILITEPYERVRAASDRWLETLAEDLAALELVRYVDDNPTDLSAYGLDTSRAAVRVRDTEATLDLVLGSPADGGRYARMADGGPVFVVAGVEQIISTRPYDTVGAFIYIVSIDLVDRVRVDTAGNTYGLRIERTPADNPEDDPVETFYFQDEEMDDELFRDLYQWIIGLLVDAEADRAPGGEPEMTVRFTLNDGSPDTEYQLLPYDSNYLAVRRDGVSEFLISRGKVGRLQNALANPESIRD